ncbi:MAG: hypothetical protein PVF04_04035, partial [Anaerolineae bacterium]
ARGSLTFNLCGRILRVLSGFGWPGAQAPQGTVQDVRQVERQRGQVVDRSSTSSGGVVAGYGLVDAGRTARPG